MFVESEFGSEVERRRRAVELVDQGVTKTEAGRRVGRSRWWVDKWVRRFAAGGDAGLEDLARVPVRQPTKTPGEVVDTVLAVRERLEKNPVANVGALTILAEMERDGFAPIPSVRTIERILQTAGVTRPVRRRERTGNTLPLPAVTTPGIWQQADWVQDRWLEGGIRFNSLQISDVGSHGIAAGQYLDRTLRNAVTFLVETAWPALSIPQTISIDNAFVKTTHRNNPWTLWTRTCLFFGVEVIVSPPGELGWTNHIEAVNHLWQSKTIWVEHFNSLQALREGSNRAVEWCNTRQPILDPAICGTRYPADYIQANRPQLRWPPTITIADHLDRNGNPQIPLTQGRITFLRHVGDHHTITIAHTQWPTPETIPTGRLVTATITTADHHLEIRHQGDTIAHYDYPINKPVTTPYYPPAPQSLLHHL